MTLSYILFMEHLSVATSSILLENISQSFRNICFQNVQEVKETSSGKFPLDIRAWTNCTTDADRVRKTSETPCKKEKIIRSTNLQSNRYFKYYREHQCSCDNIDVYKSDGVKTYSWIGKHVTLSWRRSLSYRN